MKKKRIAACVIALTMTIAGAGVVPEAFDTLLPNSVTVVEAINSADGAYSYTALSDGTVKLTKINNATSNIVIPSTIDGKTVTQIGGGINAIVSSNSDTVTSVTVPDSVTVINNKAFYNMKNLSSISIPSSVKMIFLQNISVVLCFGILLKVLMMRYRKRSSQHTVQ